MKINAGFFDRFVRFLFSGSMFYMGLYIYAGTTTGLIFTTIGLWLMLTSMLGLCPIYGLFHIRTGRGPRRWKDSHH
jgi:hypothetical protein